MSLIIGQQYPTVGRLLLLSDTRITDLVARRPLPPGEGRLKVVLPNRLTAIGFAGDPDIADDVLRSFWGRWPCSREEVAVHFRQANADCGGRADFLVAFAGENPEVVVVRDSRLDSPAIGWIGDSGAFAAFGKYIRGELGHQPSRNPEIAARWPETRSRGAFRQLVADGPVESVGDFHVAVGMGFESKLFYYQAGSESYCDREVTISSRGMEPSDYDPVTWGTYFIATLEAGEMQAHVRPQVALHFPVGNFGYFFDGSDGGFPKPVLVEGDQDRFKSTCLDRFGAEFKGGAVPLVSRD